MAFRAHPRRCCRTSAAIRGRQIPPDSPRPFHKMATPMVEASTSTCAEALLSSWIRCFGVPDDITTDGPGILVGTLGLPGTPEGDNTPQYDGIQPCGQQANGEESPAENVYGEALAVPGEFFPAEPDDPHTPLQRLREIAKKFTPCRKTFADRTHNFSPEGLKTCTLIFIRNDGHRPPLTRLYRGPYRVVSRTSKAYLVNIHGWKDWISIDRLKLTFLMESGTREGGNRQTSQNPSTKQNLR
ncbi:uncharacterized protein [Macrobrachium rosenbergii]|uniref:uncharacterized protein n=1 Tax=Macrobrachium rosenbergii TaxID=79674 RepID=UPI0034D739AA